MGAMKRGENKDDEETSPFHLPLKIPGKAHPIVFSLSRHSAYSI